MTTTTALTPLIPLSQHVRRGGSTKNKSKIVYFLFPKIPPPRKLGEATAVRGEGRFRGLLLLLTASEGG
jgi:hypothetical protein